MYFIWYKNSVLASISSVFGAGCVALGVRSMFDGELDTISAIIMIVVGACLCLLGKWISNRKEKKKAEKAAAAGAAQPKTAAKTAQPRQTVQAAQPQQTRPVSYAAPAAGNKEAKASLVFAGIGFLLAGLMCLWAVWQVGERIGIYEVNSEQVAMIAMGVWMLIATLRTKHIQEVSAWYTIGFLVMTLASAEVALRAYRDFGAYSLTYYGNLYECRFFAPLFNAIAYLLMTVFALMASKKARKSTGGVVKCLWFVPLFFLAFACMKEMETNQVREIWAITYTKGFRYPPRPEFLHTGAKFLTIFSVLLSGFAFQRICRKTDVLPVYTTPQPAPQPQYTTPQPAPQPQYTAPKPEPQYTAPQPQYTAAQTEAPRQTAQSNADIEKQMQACKDLLDCGILTQEEYEAKIRELKR